MIKKILYFIVLLIVAFLILCLFSPKQHHFSVTKNISSTPDKIFEQVGDFKNWEHWSAWHKLDPKMTINYGAATSGVGGNYSWQSEKLGSGSQKILEFVPNQKFVSQFNFKDFDASMKGTITLKDKENGTTDVTWAYDDINNIPFLFRGISVIMNMEKAISKDYNTGLNNLDAYLRNTSGLNSATPPTE